MAHQVVRDPETGQFQSVSGQDARFSDFEFKHIHSRYDVDAADLPGAFTVNEGDINSLPLDDVLHRDQRADLIMLNLHSLQAAVDGTASAENALEASWELRIGDGDAMVLNEDRTIDNDIGSSGVVDRHFWESEDPDILYFANWTAEGGYGDSTNGLGAGPDAPVLADQIHYPAEFGTCPELDRRDDITESIRFDDVGGADISDSIIHLRAAYTLVFNVRDLDR